MTEPMHEPGRTGWRVPPLLGGLLVVAVLAGLAYVSTRPLGDDGPRPSFYVIGSAVPGLQLGQIAPGTARAGSSGLAMTDPAGNPVSLADYAGHPLWVIFWKTACAACEWEAADVLGAETAHRDDGLVIIGINVWDSAAAAGDYLATHPTDYPIAVDEDGGFHRAYGIWGAPTHYFIDAAGIIQDRYFGPMTRPQMETSLRRILPPAA